MTTLIPPLARADATQFRTAAYIDGRRVKTGKGVVRELRNPATGKAIAEVPRLGVAQGQAAIEAADRALPAWRARFARATR